MQLSSKPIVVDGIDIDERDGRTRLRADIDGEEVWYSYRGAPVMHPRGEPFVAAALFPAMAQGRSIEVRSAPISQLLASSLEQIQRVIRLWNPEAHLVDVVAETRSVDANHDVVIASFSGGIDSMSTLVRHKEEITHLLSINGFDGSSDEGWDEAEAAFTGYGERLDKSCVSIDTNLHHFLERHRISWRYAHGSVLGGLMTSMGARRGYIASTFTCRDLGPWGSHPVLDPLWSTETTQIVHDAIELTRADKTEVVASDPLLLSQLQVCWRSKVKNCGECSKCVRTMLALEILGLGPGPFPTADARERIDKLKPVTDLEAAVVWDLWKFAEHHGQSDLAARMRKMLQRYKLRRAARKFVKELIGGKATLAVHKIRGVDWVDETLLLGDPTDFK